ncbi:MAG: hypothetical protein CMP20_04115 [Rickettsiales bacterium]|nr:hypothetical protein [Rickettsiales bacterium]
MTTDNQKGNVSDFHRDVSIMFLKNTTGYAVRTPRGQKDPGTIQWDPKTNNKEKSDQTITILEQTTDNLGIHLFGSLVDVDIDTDNPLMIAALDRFLPHTAHVWGRPSRKRTHRLYELAGLTSNFDPSAWKFLERIKARKDLSVEVRGGELHSARYSLLPGSVHPSGENYEWESPKSARVSVSSVSEARLMQGLRFACVAALIAAYWQEGVRNDLCKAFAGFMHRAAAYSEELNSDLMFTREDAWELMKGVMELADDDEADAVMRKKTFDQTWDKGDEGAPIVGATRIMEITDDEEIVGLLYSLLANTPDLQALDEIFEQYAVVRNTTNLIDLKLGRKGNYVMNRDSFVFTLAGKYLNTPKGRVPVSAVFLNSPRRTVVDRMAINPQREKIYENKDGMKVANTWTGWEILPCDEDTHESEVEWFTDYLLRVVCNSDQKLYTWTLQWIADIFQNPNEKAGTALVLVGKPGSGKSLLMENILRPIIGTAHSTKVGTLDKLTSKFNSHMAGQLLIQGEEVMNTNRRADADMLKDAITSKLRMIEMKGRDAFEMEDVARYTFTSNHIDKSVNVEAGDRRYTISHVSEQFAFDGGRNKEARDEYFGKLFKHLLDRNDHGEEVPNEVELAKLHRYLLKVPIDKSLIMVSCETSAKRVTQQNSSKGMDAWLLSMVDRINPFEDMRLSDKGEVHSFVVKGKTLKTTDSWPEYVQYSRLEVSMRLFTARDYGEAKSAQQIAKYFKDHGLVGSTEDRQTRAYGERVRVRPFPTRESLASYLRYRGYEVMDVKEDISEEDDNDEGPKF